MLKPIGSAQTLWQTGIFLKEVKPDSVSGASTTRANIGIFEYLRTLLGATRPHFFAFPVGAAYAGAAATAAPPGTVTLMLLGFIAGGGWGVGQLLNDVLDRFADAVDAPERPAVRGLLPPRLTVGLALLFGLILLALLMTLTPHGVWLGAASMLLIVTYNRCKSMPFLGNISHGALLSCAALIGASVAKPTSSVSALVSAHVQILAFVFVWAALYVQANYEKDMRGDRIAGYRTLAHAIGVRKSARLRAVVAALSLLLLPEALRSPWTFLPMALCATAIAAAALYLAHRGTTEAALSLYRVPVHAGTLGMLTLGAPVLHPLGYPAALVLAALLTECAFHRTPNP